MEKIRKKAPLDPNKEVAKFLKKNPQIQEALDVFAISSAQYKKSVSSSKGHKIITSANNTNGDLD